MDSLYQGRRNPALPTRIVAALDLPSPVFEVESDLDHLPKGATRTTRLALEATCEALHHAALPVSLAGRSRVGVCIGTTVGCTLNNEPFYRHFKQGRLDGMKPIRTYLENNPAQYIAKYVGATGPVVAVVNACSSGSDAIGMARAWVARGWCDIAIAGGADELSRVTYLGFNSLLNTSPEPCRPFDIDRKGLNLGEGAGICILESEASALLRKQPVLAELAGYGSAADAYHPTAPHPEGNGLRSAIRYALAMANLQTRDIDFVNAHGTATAENDKTEGKVIGALFGEVPVVSTKSYTGHALGGAGGIEAVLTVQALLDQKLPATAGFAQRDPECVITPTHANVSLHAQVGISNSLAFGGNNSALVFKRSE